MISKEGRQNTVAKRVKWEEGWKDMVGKGVQKGITNARDISKKSYGNPLLLMLPKISTHTHAKRIKMYLPYIEATMPLNSQDNKMPSARNRLPLLELLASKDP